MSKHFRIVPSVFLHYHGPTLFERAVDRTQLEGRQDRLQKKHDGSCQHQASFILRDDHVVLLAVDALLALYASFRKWRNRRRTLLALADLDDRQLRDIGLIRDGDQYRSLAGSDEEGTVSTRL